MLKLPRKTADLHGTYIAGRGDKIMSFPSER
jgi:hypothetical protein